LRAYLPSPLSWFLAALGERHASQVNTSGPDPAWQYVALSGHCPVDLPTVAHPHDEDDEPLVHDLVDDPVIARSASLAKYRSIASSRALKSSMGTTAATGWPLRVMVVGVPPALA
jgi:hypothetical protein